MNHIAAVLLAIWGAGLSLAALRAFLGYQTLWWLYRGNSIPFPRTDIDVNQLSQRAGCRRPWRLLQCATREMAVPITWGLFRSTVMLPADADRWPKRRLEAVILHELAHVRRCDFIRQACVEAFCCVLWFIPQVWEAAEAIRNHAEHAADRLVTESGIRPSDYAEELLAIAAELGRRKLPWFYTGAPAMRGTKIEPRIHAVLRSGRRSGGALVWLLMGVFVATASFGVFQSTVSDQKKTYPADREEARARMKLVALGTIMYVNDYDGVFPYVQSTATARIIIHPYLKDSTDFESPTPGGHFWINLHLGGVEMPPDTLGDVSAATTGNGAAPTAQTNQKKSIFDSAKTPMWTETLPTATDPFGVAFADGHAILTTDHSTTDKALRQPYPRPTNSKPLPPRYMIDEDSSKAPPP